ncbi:unnamed protein product [Rotaria magnacalcarata]|uniref:BED-type domain-containing protein n=4 Tax=Rotaria magnacalcarata TaxID=392030 RepID=A0A815IF28_9BILA|nr:unnamed protein product [Rotaria magnacalcarata]CAF1362893.1 unnamed protein product [Rotaria magnacalcarata]CAF2131096.1 unnamed protein product [Rotaria magnacalcarata]CAF3896446.1 unnamed protein product [Rotaria magnacalcarata]
MKRKRNSEKSNNLREKSAGASSAISKSGQSAAVTRRVAGLSADQATNITRNRQTCSDISSDENEDAQPAKRRRVSMVHTYAKKVSNVEYECNVCSKAIRCSVDSNASIRRHLLNVHRVDDVNPKSGEPKLIIQIDPFRKSKLDEAAIKCIIVDSRPFGDFRKRGMRDFLAAAVPGYPGPHERTLQRNIKKLYANKLFELREKLKNVQYVCLTTDLWRRPRQHHYLCATIHYVDENFGNVSTIVSCRRFHGRHLAVRIRNHICRIVNRSQNFDVDDDSDGIQNEGDEMDESDQEDELNDELEDREEETPTTLDDDSDGSGDHDSADDDDDICEVPEDDTDNVSSDEEPEKNETTSDNNAFDIKDISLHSV